ncbi:MAG: hypothetical protein R2856_28030 [Caldilineaceae bacterium]
MENCSFGMTPEELIDYTPDFTGERFADGRPRVPDNIIERMRHVTTPRRGACCVGMATTTNTPTVSPAPTRAGAGGAGAHRASTCRDARNAP